MGGPGVSQGSPKLPKVAGFQGGLRGPKCTQGSPGWCERYPKGPKGGPKAAEEILKGFQRVLIVAYGIPRHPQHCLGGVLKGTQRVPSAA